MTVIVDELRIYPNAKHRCFREGSAHLMTDADTLDELHAFAARLGLRRSWFQPRSSPHYDLSPAKHALALKLGAKLVPAREQAAARIARRLPPRSSPASPARPYTARSLVGARWMRAASATNIHVGSTHLVLSDGTTACQGDPVATSYYYVRLLAGPWVEPEDERHVCGYCRRAKVVICKCSRCAMRLALVRAKSEGKDR